MAKNNWANMNFQQIMLQQAQQSLDNPAYCRYCGKNIKEPSKESRKNMTGENTGNYAAEWELKNNAHYSCYEKNRYGGRR
jgi:hypothetical protein